MGLPCLCVLLAFFSIACSAYGQSTTEGFLSIDCGVSSGYSYVDKTTKITYVSDDQFIDAGVNSEIANSYMGGASYQDQTVRSFPTGDRNCYTLNVTKGNKYLLRSIFMYGNYDGLKSAQTNKPLLFDLYLGVDKWNTVKIPDSSTEYKMEAITVAEVNTLSICLINTGHGTPFISALEMRPLISSLYPESVSGSSISFLYRFNYGATTNQVIRYPDDPLDRIWDPYPDSSSDWKTLSVASNDSAFIRNSAADNYRAPVAVYKTAVAPTNSPNMTVLQWIPENVSTAYYSHFFLCELEKTSALRQFTIYLNEYLYFSLTLPPYLEMTYIFSTIPLSLDRHVYGFSQWANSTLPPIVNAVEILSVFNHTVPLTYAPDADAITAIKVYYGLKKNWMGDPCNPRQYLWDGLSCTYNAQPTIASINLSSSGLTGGISNSFSQFGSIKILDLSCNNLSGPIPDFLGSISTLQTIDLRGNSFVGSMPDALLKKNNSGLLKLITGPCNPSSANSHSSSKTVIIAIAIAIPAIIIVIVVLVVLFLRKRSKQDSAQTSQPPIPVGMNPPVPNGEPILNSDVRPYTYKQVENITTQFSQVIGEGGFGIVYRGALENGTDVAVKLSSQAALNHVVKQFQAEAKNLTLVHHRNLVSLVGYCKEGNYVALIYEYMPNGSLHDHLRGKLGNNRALDWGERVKIALDAAQGLHYLHTGCNMVHRDVKSSNILLGKQLEAKVADFGLSKIFTESGVLQTMTLCGTPGYIDPEAHITHILNDKSDVYSFGVVLLEIVTGEPPILVRRNENMNIIQHVNQKLHGGNITEVADPRLRGEYDENSIWKVVDLAMDCTSSPASHRPAMADIVKILQDSLEHENKPRNKVFRVESTTGSHTSEADVSFSSFNPLPR